MRRRPFVIGLLVGVLSGSGYLILQEHYSLPKKNTSVEVRVVSLVPDGRSPKHQELRVRIVRGGYSASELDELAREMAALPVEEAVRLMANARFHHEEAVLCKAVLRHLVDANLSKAAKLADHSPKRLDADEWLVEMVVENQHLEGLRKLVGMPVDRSAILGGLSEFFLSEGTREEAIRILRAVAKEKGSLDEIDRRALFSQWNESLSPTLLARISDPSLWAVHKLDLVEAGKSLSDAGFNAAEVEGFVRNATMDNSALVSETLFRLADGLADSAEEADGDSTVTSKSQFEASVHRKAVTAFLSYPGIDAMYWAASLNDPATARSSMAVILSAYFNGHPIHRNEFLDKLEEEIRVNSSAELAEGWAQWLGELRSGDTTRYEEVVGIVTEGQFTGLMGYTKVRK